MEWTRRHEDRRQYDRRNVDDRLQGGLSPEAMEAARLLPPEEVELVLACAAAERSIRTERAGGRPIRRDVQRKVKPRDEVMGGELLWLENVPASYQAFASAICFVDDGPEAMLRWVIWHQDDDEAGKARFSMPARCATFALAEKTYKHWVDDAFGREERRRRGTDRSSINRGSPQSRGSSTRTISTFSRAWRYWKA